MRCRRCDSIRLIRLDKKSSQDNDVFRCQECGYLFSPSTSAEAPKQQVSSQKNPDAADSGGPAGHLPAERGQS